MSGGVHVATDADVRADLAKALALPSDKQPKVNHNSLIDGIDMVAVLRRVCIESGGQRRFAARMGVTDAFVSMVMHGKRAPTPAILAALGLRKVVTVQYALVNGGAA